MTTERDVWRCHTREMVTEACVPVSWCRLCLYLGPLEIPEGAPKSLPCSRIAASLVTGCWSAFVGHVSVVFIVLMGPCLIGLWVISFHFGLWPAMAQPEGPWPPHSSSAGRLLQAGSGSPPAPSWGLARNNTQLQQLS